jgi:hypothetical protein
VLAALVIDFPVRASIEEEADTVKLRQALINTGSLEQFRLLVRWHLVTHVRLRWSTPASDYRTCVLVCEAGHPGAAEAERHHSAETAVASGHQGHSPRQREQLL